jgi:hypothetical protein
MYEVFNQGSRFISGQYFNKLVGVWENISIFLFLLKYLFFLVEFQITANRIHHDNGSCLSFGIDTRRTTIQMYV